MRLLVFFDLPMVTNKDLSQYRKFRKFLLDNGFVMMQESVYCRLVLNSNSGMLLKKQIIKNLPTDGLIQLMQITEKQFAEIETLSGEQKSNILSTVDRVVEI